MKGFGLINAEAAKGAVQPATQHHVKLSRAHNYRIQCHPGKLTTPESPMKLVRCPSHGKQQRHEGSESGHQQHPEKVQSSPNQPSAPVASPWVEEVAAAAWPPRLALSFPRKLRFAGLACSERGPVHTGYTAPRLSVVFLRSGSGGLGTATGADCLAR